VSRSEATRNLLEMVPERVPDWADAGEGKVKVLVPRYGASRLGRWFARQLGRPHICVNLDDIGSTVWRSCDGRATVQEIARTLESEFGERIAPVNERLGKFFAELERGRLIRWRETR